MKLGLEVQGRASRGLHIFLRHFWIFIGLFGVRRGLKMILSHRAPSSLNMSSYRAIWTHFKPNFIFVGRKNLRSRSKNPDFLKCKSHHLAILINISIYKWAPGLGVTLTPRLWFVGTRAAWHGVSKWVPVLAPPWPALWSSKVTQTDNLTSKMDPKNRSQSGSQ